MTPRWYALSARVRGLATLGGMVAVLGGVFGGLALGDAAPATAVLAVSLGGFALLAVGTALHFVAVVPRLTPRRLSPPVRGRWSALNSPASRVPSHGSHGHGQTFAIDLVFEPDDDSRPRFGSGPGFRPPTDFPGFGQPLYAPATGTVVAVRDQARDHLSRSNWPAFGYLMLEGVVRELGGSRFAIGNHVVIRTEDGAYALLAHLRHGAATVRVGQRVEAGERIGECGNSGNTSEPHVHVQLMDSPRPFLAAGLPFTFSAGGTFDAGDGADDAGAGADGVLPRNGQAATFGTRAV